MTQNMFLDIVKLGGIIGCKDKTSSWHLNGFPDGSNIGSTVQCRGETHRYAVHLQQSPCRDTRQNKDERHDEPGYSSILFHWVVVFLFIPPSRARSLRNLLVSGNECGRVFPAGVGPGSPSRDAANWLPSRFSLSVETRRRYGWLRMMVFPGARLFPSPNLVPFGRVAARERQGALSRRAW